MLSTQEFADAWEEDRFLFPPDLLRDIDIPDDAKAFLVEVGLPGQAEMEGKYVIPLPVVPACPPVQAAKYLLMAPVPPSPHRPVPLRLIACLQYESDHEYWGFDVYYAIEETSGHVHCLRHPADAGEEINQFVNVSVAQFAECLFAFRLFMSHFRPTYPEDGEVDLLLTSLGQRWQEIDPVALADPEGYWVNQLEDFQTCF